MTTSSTAESSKTYPQTWITVAPTGIPVEGPIWAIHSYTELAAGWMYPLPR